MRYLLIIGLTFLFLSCSKEDSPVQPVKEPVVTAENYFPGGVGSLFEYSVLSIDSTNQIIDSSGTNKISFDSTESYGGIEYIASSTAFVSSGATVPLKFLFRRSSAGVYFTIDTTGLTTLLPDSLLQNVTINSDIEANVFSYPLFEGKTWTAYKLNIGIGAFELSLIDVQARYAGLENISSSATGNVDAEKIIYSADIKIPDPNNLISYNEIKFDINAWFAKDIGIVMIESNPLAANIISGTTVFEPDSSILIKQILSSYNIK